MKRLRILAPALMLFVMACGEAPTEPSPVDDAQATANASTTNVPFTLLNTEEPWDLLGSVNNYVGSKNVLRVNTNTGGFSWVGGTGFHFVASAMATSKVPVPVAGGVTYPAGTHFGVMQLPASCGWCATPEWIVVVDTNSGTGTKVVRVQEPPNVPGRGLAFGPNGSTLYLITDAGKLYTIDLVTGEQVWVKDTHPSAALDWDPDGGSFVSTNGGYLWRVFLDERPDERLSNIGWTPCTIARSPEGQWFSFYGRRLRAISLTADGYTNVGGSYRPYEKVCGTAFAPQHIVNGPPTAEVGGPYNASTGEPVPFSGGGSDPEGSDLTYAWDFGDGSTAEGTMASGETSTPDKVYTQPGVYTVTFTVTDDAGISRTVETTATIEGEPPPPQNTAPQVTLNDDVVTSHGQLFSTDGVFLDPDADDDWTWTIDWGDGSEAESSPGIPGEHVALEHQYPDEVGSWTITFTVTDGAGGVGQAQQTLTFTNAPPEAVLGFHPYVEGENICTYLEGGQACIHGGDSSDPDVLDDVSTLTFFFEYGDPAGSTWEQPGVEGQPPFVYADNGTYQVTLTVTDGLGASDTDTKPVTIENVAPKVGVAPGGQVELGDPYDLGAGFKDPGTEDSPWSWTIDWGDGEISTASVLTQGKGTIQASHTFTTQGTFTVTVCVTDKDGGEGCSSTTVEVVDTTPPVILFEGNQDTYSLIDAVEIICTAYDTGSGLASDSCLDFVGPAWSFGAGETSYTATATDNAGNTASEDMSFTVEVTADGLCALVRQFVSHHGIANSLCVKLNASAKAKRVGSHNGPLEAFISEVEAQSGKKINPEDALVLIAMANELMW